MSTDWSCRGAVVVVFVCLVTACSEGQYRESEVEFAHNVTGEVRPWTHENFDAEQGKFTFAVFSDLTGGEREGIFEIAVAQLAMLRPEFIINVGDLIEGGTQDLPEIEAQWNSFDRRAQRTPAPVFYVGGNHDLSGAVLQGVWAERLGPSYYHFVYKNVLFLVLDTEDNTTERTKYIFEARNRAIEVVKQDGWEAFTRTEYFGLPEQRGGNVRQEQSHYFQDVLSANPDVRWTFLFMHKAPWKRENESNFAAIEQALSTRPYTVFNGHAHSYEHEERHGRDYIRLATTGGTQFTDRGLSADHVTLVTVSESGADIVNLLMEGILDKTGHIPLDGDQKCFEVASCEANEEGVEQ